MVVARSSSSNTKPFEPTCVVDLSQAGLLPEHHHASTCLILQTPPLEDHQCFAASASASPTISQGGVDVDVDLQHPHSFPLRLKLLRLLRDRYCFLDLDSLALPWFASLDTRISHSLLLSKSNQGNPSSPKITEQHARAAARDYHRAPRRSFVSTFFFLGAPTQFMSLNHNLYSIGNPNTMRR